MNLTLIDSFSNLLSLSMSKKVDGHMPATMLYSFPAILAGPEEEPDKRSGLVKASQVVIIHFVMSNIGSTSIILVPCSVLDSFIQDLMSNRITSSMKT